MQSTLNTELLAGMLKSKRANKGLRAIADEIGGVSAATLSRIEQGKVPDVDTFIKICKWLQVSTDSFIISNSETSPVSNREQVVAHLRAERELSTDTVNMLIKMIDLAYSSK
ncbi:helix-turn-helix domain-containing protein [Chitinophaga ginsengisegetis]|uniref:helix-turn-helix domain-containing protein n=1 Tax=Chitinophaga ginsengisegetis TaxID=393003 RepID=UPI000DB93F2E|nr:helix-turn-helix transcriptional regulator [Chitinophaga ginsengisegetis]MDR6571348.1 transcriptional regulator with XRE-family HTH domain [Chitinophaga ginsengisegetis]MDR6651083.1 transcriptional regulator with XRE-family HTH domain [Chitinophaga ginsengisegetis]MDR6657433.1 transcriptional regulator with XRE-family HTH domain [Chitinophaga ginsengisegetis]